jgi:membrane protein required for colicin V production
MTWFDYIVLGIIGVSVLFSIIHGLVRELLSLASWIIAFGVAQYYADTLAPLLPVALTNPAARLLLAFLAIFIAVLIATTLVAIVISGLLRRAGFSSMDRMLGAVFGFVRGLAISLFVVLAAGLTTLPKEPVWRQAVLSGPLVKIANVAKIWLPYDLAKHINYD